MDTYGVGGGGARHVAEAAKIAQTVCRPNAADVDKSGRFPQEAISALGRAGLFGLCVPEAMGGQGQGPRTFCAVVEEIAAECASTAMVYVMHVTAAQAIARSTSLGDRDALLQAIAKGRHLTTLAFSEKGSRSNFWLPVSKLEPRGDGFVTNAAKSYVTAASHADSYVSSAQCPGAASPLESTCYLVRKGRPGARVAAPFDGMGLRGNDSAAVSIEGYAVHAADLLCEHGKGLEVMLQVVLPFFSIGTAAMANGICRAAVSLTASHLSSTALETGGRLRDLPNLRARVAQMSVRTEQSRALLWRTLHHLEHPSEATPLYVLEARLGALEAAVEVTDLAMKAGGGAAFSRHIALERLFRDARAGWVMAPTVDHLQDFIGKALTGLPLV